MLRIYLLLIIASAAIAQVPFLGSCPTVETMQNFDMERVCMIIAYFKVYYVD